MYEDDADLADIRAGVSRLWPQSQMYLSHLWHPRISSRKQKHQKTNLTLPFAEGMAIAISVPRRKMRRPDSVSLPVPTIKSILPS